MISADFLIIGAGIVGISIALELKKRYPESTIVLVEKEKGLGKHSSGRNSGVLHSGIYYAPGSLKAQVCRQGAMEMADLHLEYKLRMRQCGKILVVADHRDSTQLIMLADRAQQHGIPIEMLDRQQLYEMEPEARSVLGQAIYVPGTAVGDPTAVMQVLQKRLQQEGIQLRYDSRVVHVDTYRRLIKTASGEAIRYGHAINTAGLHADVVAHQFSCGERYTLLPFKGIYWKLNPASGIHFRHLVYPVPDLRVPFLGVHTTTTVDGSTYLGPTAVPAFGRENYRGLQGLELQEAVRIMLMLSRQFCTNKDGFRRLAMQEGGRYFKHGFSMAARAIAPRIQPKDLLPTSKVGIRAQAYDKQEKKLIDDFMVVAGPNSTHILNAISPAWTSAFPFARYICDRYLG